MWRPDEVVTATLPEDPEVPVVITAPGVLDVVNPNVTVTVTGATAETPLVLAMGRESDIRAWLADSPHLEVTGLTDWETLTVEEGPAVADPGTGATDDAATEGTETTDDAATDEAATDDAATDEAATDDAATDEAATDDAATDPTDPAESATDEAPAEMATVPNPAGSDLWIEELTGTGELTYDWTAVDGRWMMLIATDGTTPAPQLGLTWTREVETPFVVPGVIVGGVLVLIGLVLGIMTLLVDRETKRAKARAVAAGSESAAAVTVPTVGADGAPLTRRQLREAQAQAEQESRSGRGRDSAASPDDATVVAGAAGTGAAATTDSSDTTDEVGATNEQDVEATQSVTGTPADGQEAAASDLADWVSSGRSGAEAAPIETYASDAPGAGLPAVSGADGAGDADEAEQAAKRRPWWRRNGADTTVAGTEGETTADGDATPSGGDGATRRRSWRPDRWGAPTTGAAGATTAAAVEPPPEPAGAQSPADANPQASGASWRQTWGLGAPMAADAETTGVIEPVEPGDDRPGDDRPGEDRPTDDRPTDQRTEDDS
ncbi:hypothetical protein [Occultella gossypii]|uniref:Uncharacterized protein n=1 Tax=Occultella gossypii TaxID=2800820 RepID=A0ABS7SGM8_9MICO|nr:hypothetical protein [Occultella gossypii]MBZ2199515.1 hypothetical protein [Occultella gossypii]